MTLEWTEETLCRAARQMTQGLAAALPEEDVPSPAPAERLRRVTRRARWRRLGQRAAMIALTAVLASGGQGLAYALCLPGGDVRPVCKALNEAFGGRGGGKPGFCQGSLACTDFADVQNFLVNYHE